MTTPLLPGPPGSTNGDYWVGDSVRLNTGAGEFDFSDDTFRVEAISVQRADENAELVVIPELAQIVIPSAPGIWSYFYAWDNGAPTGDEWPAGIPPDGVVLVSYETSRYAGSGGTEDYNPQGVSDDLGPNWNISPAATQIGSYVVIDISDLSNYDAGMWVQEASGIISPYYATENPQGTDAPQFHAVGLAGVSPTPSVTDFTSNISIGWGGGSRTCTSGDIVCPGPGILLAGFTAGYAFASTPSWSAVSPSVTLTFGTHQTDDPISWLGYRIIDAAGTYSVEATTNGGDKFSRCVAFFPSLT